MFNFGSGKFQASTLRQKLNRGEYLNAANELPRWIHVKGGVKLQGLVKRRQIERSLFLSEADTASIVNEIAVASNAETNYLK
ncbi:glycoside hydrolase family protein [Rickettsia hoogstraalii]|uniref:lysozyme n=1 Tax=Rickettsia hoogstraalii TaxID=467174 RepID=UPI0022542B58|nr:glycoside hydrolase family protein [Rickettsia hoogstraalii]MCX4083844.1 glycoside hydrolase family protein [Rickettsia hoogstraalii]